MTVRIVIADDHAVLRSGLRALLAQELDLAVVGEAANGQALLAELERAAADVVVLDLSMPGTHSGSQVAEQVLQRFPRTRVVVLTMHEDPYYLRELFRVGVHGYVLKKSAPQDVVRAVRAAHRGEYHVDAALGGQAVASLMVPPPRGQLLRLEVLTPREQEVCRLLALGFTNTEVAQRLGISDRTVETHRTSIMRKLELRSRAELVRFALDQGLLT